MSDSVTSLSHHVLPSESLYLLCTLVVCYLQIIIPVHANHRSAIGLRRTSARNPFKRYTVVIIYASRTILEQFTGDFSAILSAISNRLCKLVAIFFAISRQYDLNFVAMRAECIALWQKTGQAPVCALIRWQQKSPTNRSQMTGIV